MHVNKFDFPPMGNTDSAHGYYPKIIEHMVQVCNNIFPSGFIGRRYRTPDLSCKYLVVDSIRKPVEKYLHLAGDVIDIHRRGKEYAIIHISEPTRRTPIS